MSDRTRDRLARVLADTVGVEPSTVVDHASFRDDLDIDSLTLVEVTMALEDEFGVRLGSDEGPISFASVHEAVALIEDRIGEPA